jgi:hypothetical protein
MGLAVPGAACAVSPSEDFYDHNAFAQARLIAADFMMWRGKDDSRSNEEGSTAQRSDPQNAA